MKNAIRLSSLFASASLLAFVGCVDPNDEGADATDGDSASSSADQTSNLPPGTPKAPHANISSTPADVAAAIAALDDAEIVSADADGVPRHVRGSLGRITGQLSDNPQHADQQVRGALQAALAAFRLNPSALSLRKMNHGADGIRHLRYTQKHQGLDVIGGDLIVSVDRKGTIYAVQGTGRGDFPASAGQSAIGKQAASAAVAQDPRFHGMQQDVGRQVYLHAGDALAKAYEVEVIGTRGEDPVRDLVYVDVDSAAILAVHPQIHHAKNRSTYNLNHATSLPGVLVRTEGQGSVGEIDVDSAHDLAGITYDAYKLFWNRDSFDGAGALIKSSVHYSNGYCNAFWNGSQMVYGDGNGSTCKNLARSIDVTAHEMTHAVTTYDSNLTYAGESGGINESMSDVFGAFAEAYKDGGQNGTLAVDGDTWLIGETVLPPFLRDMCNPAADGVSKDFWYSGVGTVDVHYSSGIGNLMFCLLTKGGTHPAGKSNIAVPGIGLDKAIKLAYYANANELVASSTYADYRIAMMDSAEILYGLASPERDAVDKAFQAVGVGVVVEAPAPILALRNGSTVSNLSGDTGSEKVYKIDVPAGTSTLTVQIAGGTGDADLYVKNGALPTTTSYNCRPFLSGNNETCTFQSPAAGTWYIMVRGYAAYSGVSLTATAATTSAASTLYNNVAVSPISGASSSEQYWQITVPSGKNLTFTMSGGTGDADLYVRHGAKPTTSTFNCRPYLLGNNETCNFASSQSGTYYVMVRGYASFSGVSLKAAY